MYQENWWFATAMLVYKSDFFEKKKNLPSNSTDSSLHWACRAPGLAGSWKSLEKNRSSGGRVHHFFALKKTRKIGHQNQNLFWDFRSSEKKVSQVSQKTNKKIEGNEKERHVCSTTAFRWLLWRRSQISFLEESFHKTFLLQNHWGKYTSLKRTQHLKANGPGSQNGTGLSQPSIFRCYIGRVPYFPQQFCAFTGSNWPTQDKGGRHILSSLTSSRRWSRDLSVPRVCDFFDPKKREVPHDCNPQESTCLKFPTFLL